MMNRISAAALLLAILAPALPAQLDGVSARLYGSLGVSYPPFGYPCRQVIKTTTIGDGVEVTGAEWIQPFDCPGTGAFNVDFSGNTLALTTSLVGNYHYGLLSVTLFGGPVITGFNFVGYTGTFFNPASVMNQSSITPVTSFTDHTLYLEFPGAAPRLGYFQLAGTDPGGAALFSITTADPITATPEPATLTLTASGLVVLLGVATWRTRRAAIRVL